MLLHLLYRERLKLGARELALKTRMGNRYSHRDLWGPHYTDLINMCLPGSCTKVSKAAGTTAHGQKTPDVCSESRTKSGNPTKTIAQGPRNHKISVRVAAAHRLITTDALNSNGTEWSSGYGKEKASHKGYPWAHM